MKNLKTYFLISFLLLQHVANAAGIKFTASAQKNPVAAGEAFQLVYTIENADVKNFTPPAFSGFQVLQGPFQSSNMSVVNGRMSQSISLTYVLQAAKEGKFNIGAATAITSQGTIESNGLTIDVSKAAPASVGNAQGQQNNAAAKTDLSKQIFLKVFVDKTSVYEGEQITASYKLYTRASIVNYQFEKMPTLTGFWSQNFDVPQGVATQENVNGVVYNVVELKRVALFAQQSGNLNIDPIEMKLTARVKSGKKRKSVFDDIFGNDPFFDDPFFSAYEDVPLTVQTAPVAINVKALPANKPVGFSGAVGRFKMSAAADKTSLTTDDAITYKVTISGTGNLHQFDNPVVNMPPDFEVYDPKIAENIPKNQNPIGGSKTFEYLIIPRVSGDYKIPALDFSYFDLDKKDYVTLHSNEIAVQIKQGKNQNNATVNGVKKEDLKLLGQDIRYIKTNDVKFEKGNGGKFFGTMWFWCLSLLPIILSAAVLIYVKMQKTLMGDKSAMAFKQASRLARKRLQVAEKLLKQKNEKGFYDEVMRSLHGYVSNKMKIQTADLSKENIVTSFQQKNIGDETSAKFIHVLDDCEMALYAPSAVQGGMEQVYKNATELIVDLESKII